MVARHVKRGIAGYLLSASATVMFHLYFSLLFHLSGHPDGLPKVATPLEYQKPEAVVDGLWVHFEDSFSRGIAESLSLILHLPNPHNPG